MSEAPFGTQFQLPDGVESDEFSKLFRCHVPSRGWSRLDHAKRQKGRGGQEAEALEKLMYPLASPGFGSRLFYLSAGVLLIVHILSLDDALQNNYICIAYPAASGRLWIITARAGDLSNLALRRSTSETIIRCYRFPPTCFVCSKIKCLFPPGEEGGRKQHVE